MGVGAVVLVGGVSRSVEDHKRLLPAKDNCAAGSP